MVMRQFPGFFPQGGRSFLSGIGDDLLEEDPRLAYQAFQNVWGRTPGQRRFYQNAFDLLQNQYLGQLGQLIMQGQDPTLKFTEFLKGFNFPEFYHLQGGLRRPSKFSPFARFQF